MGFDWPVISWLLNALATLALLLACLVVAIGILATGRFFYWSNLKTLLSGKLPRFTEVKAALRFLGQELSGNALLDSARDEEIVALQEQVDGLAGKLEVYEKMIEEITILLSEPEH